MTALPGRSCCRHPEVRQAYLEGQIEQLWQRIGAPEPDGLLFRDGQGEIMLNCTQQRGQRLVMVAAQEAAAAPMPALLPHLAGPGGELADAPGVVEMVDMMQQVAGMAPSVLGWLLHPDRDFSQELRHLAQSAREYAGLLRFGQTGTLQFQQLHDLLRPAGAPVQSMLAMIDG